VCWCAVTATLADLAAPSTERIKEMDTRILQKKEGEGTHM
jgi:hypothetical protein